MQSRKHTTLPSRGLWTKAGRQIASGAKAVRLRGSKRLPACPLSGRIVHPRTLGSLQQCCRVALRGPRPRNVALRGRARPARRRAAAWPGSRPPAQTRVASTSRTVSVRRFAERILWKICRVAGSVRFDARELHHFGGLFGFVGEELTEVGR